MGIKQIAFYAFMIVVLIVVVGCSKKIVTSADDPGPPGSIHDLPKGCFVMKNAH